MVLSLDTTDGRPLVERVADALRNAIRSGRWSVEERLPSTRDLAERLGLHRNTVKAAYELLVAEGWLEGHVGRGTFVRRSSAPPPRARGEARPQAYQWRLAGAWWGDTLRGALGITAPAGGMEGVSFARGIPDSRLYPARDIERIARRVLRQHGDAAYRYGSPLGYDPLREWIGGWLALEEGVDLSGREVLISNGSSQAFDMVLRLLARPSDIVAVSAPCYPGALQLMEVHGVQAVGLSVGIEGWDIGAIERTLPATRPALVHVMPRYHNPTGVSLSADGYRRLLDVAEATGVPLFEDDFARGLRLEGVEPRTLLSRDRRGQVLFAGTFSKMLFPGFRIGWLVAPDCLLTPLSELRRRTEIATSLLPQMILHEFCRMGFLDRHLRKVRRVYRKRRDALLEAMERHFPDSLVWSRPKGGLVVWVGLPEGVDSFALARAARRAGVEITPATFFLPPGHRGNGFRLSYGDVPEERMEAAVKVLGRILREHLERGGVSGEAALGDASWAV